MKPTIAVLFLLLAGCAQPAETVTDEQPVQETPASAEVVVAGRAVWNDPDRDPLEAYDLATMAAVNPCVWESGRGHEVYFNNLRLASTLLWDDIPNGTHALEVTFTWSMADYPHDRLVLAYQPAGRDRPFESDWIPNGVPTIVETEPSSRDGIWTFWACVSRAGAESMDDPAGEGLKPFVGTLQYKIRVLA